MVVDKIDGGLDIYVLNLVIALLRVTDFVFVVKLKFELQIVIVAVPLLYILGKGHIVGADNAPTINDKIKVQKSDMLQF